MNLSESYADEAADLRQEINDILHKAQVIENAGDLSDAAKVYLSTYRTVRNVERGRAHSTRGRVYNAPRGIR